MLSQAQHVPGGGGAASSSVGPAMNVEYATAGRSDTCAVRALHPILPFCCCWPLVRHCSVCNIRITAGRLASFLTHSRRKLLRAGMILLSQQPEMYVAWLICGALCVLQGCRRIISGSTPRLRVVADARATEFWHINCYPAELWAAPHRPVQGIPSLSRCDQVCPARTPCPVVHGYAG